jgi:hypothetical protein
MPFQEFKNNMSNWFKLAWNRGRPLMEEYTDGRRPDSEDHMKDDTSLVNAKPEFGGNERPGYPTGYSQDSENSDDDQWARLHGTIPGEAVLMDDGGDSHDGLGDAFTSKGEGTSDNDVIPQGGKSKALDNAIIGPHNMQKNVFKRVKRDTRVKGLNF